MRLFAALIIISAGVPRGAAAQAKDVDSTDRAYFTLQDEAPLSCLLTYFPPLFIQHGIELKSFLRSKTFRHIRDRFGDVRALDAVYVRSMQLTDNNTAVALLLSTIASFDHRVVGLKVPILQLYFPLSNESQPEFDRRVGNLPTKLYPDTPPGGDHDKLEHFFGSAFLTVAFETEEGADRVGIFVEKGEDAFIVGGVADARDLRADREGQRFGMALLENNRRMPSEFLGTEKAPEAAPPDGEPACAGVW
ncbi:MAG TPA: hypothetical protein VES59_06275 [Bacteroidota bacterium]|nr:hypothetical protein [Bacteroidota bacterium]